VSGHKVILEAVEGGGPEWRFECGYDAANESRPCWPLHEDESRYDTAEGIREGCIFVPWFEVYDGAIRNMPTITFDAEAEWMGDYYDFDLTIEETP